MNLTGKVASDFPSVRRADEARSLGGGSLLVAAVREAFYPGYERDGHLPSGPNFSPLTEWTHIAMT